MAFDENNYVAPAPGGGYNSVVGGQTQWFPDQTSAERNYNDRTGQPNQPVASGGGGYYTNPAVAGLAAQVADNAAQIAYYNRRLELIDVPMLEIEKERLALQKYQEEWQRAYQEKVLDLQTKIQTGQLDLAKERQAADIAAQQAGLTGYYGGSPTFQREQWQQDQRLREAELFGYELPSYSGGQTSTPQVSSQWYQRMVDFWPQFKATHEGRSPTGEEWTNAFAQVTGLSPKIGREMYRRGMDYIQTGGTRAPQDVQDAWLRQLTSGQAYSPGQSGGSGAPAVSAPRETLQARMWREGQTGYVDGAPTLERQRLETDTALRGLELGASLQGPSNYFRYLRTMGNTPGGLRDLIGAAAGRYVLPQSAGSAQPYNEPLTVASIARDVASGGASQYGGGQGRQSGQGEAGLPAYAPPNQWAPQNVARMSPTQRELLVAGYADETNWLPQDIEHAFRQSLPKYGGPRYGQVAF